MFIVVQNKCYFIHFCFTEHKYFIFAVLSKNVKYSVQWKILNQFLGHMKINSQDARLYNKEDKWTQPTQSELTQTFYPEYQPNLTRIWTLRAQSGPKLGSNRAHLCSLSTLYWIEPEFGPIFRSPRPNLIRVFLPWSPNPKIRSTRQPEKLVGFGRTTNINT